MKVCTDCLSIFQDDYRFCPLHATKLSAVRGRVPAPGEQVCDFKLEKIVSRDSLGTLFRAYRQGEAYGLRQISPLIMAHPVLNRAIRSMVEESKGAEGAFVPTEDSRLENESTFYLWHRWQPEPSLHQLIEDNLMTPMMAFDILLLILRALEKQKYPHGALTLDNITVRTELGRPTDIRITDAFLWQIFPKIDLKPIVEDNPNFFHAIAATVSPEFLLGRKIDARSDIYGLCCLLWQMLCRRPIFSGSVREVLQAQLNEEPPPFSQVYAKEGADDLDDILGAASAKFPGARFQNVNAFANALSATIEASLANKWKEADREIKTWWEKHSGVFDVSEVVNRLSESAATVEEISYEAKDIEIDADDAFDIFVSKNTIDRFSDSPVQYGAVWESSDSLLSRESFAEREAGSSGEPKKLLAHFDNPVAERPIDGCDSYAEGGEAASLGHYRYADSAEKNRSRSSVALPSIAQISGAIKSTARKSGSRASLSVEDIPRAPQIRSALFIPVGSQHKKVKDVETNDVETKDVETKDVETKDVETNDVETKDVETKDVETKDVETNDVETPKVSALPEKIVALREKRESALSLKDRLAGKAKSVAEIEAHAEEKKPSPSANYRIPDFASSRSKTPPSANALPDFEAIEKIFGSDAPSEDTDKSWDDILLDNDLFDIDIDVERRSVPGKLKGLAPLNRPHSLIQNLGAEKSDKREKVSKSIDAAMEKNKLAERRESRKGEKFNEFLNQVGSMNVRSVSVPIEKSALPEALPDYARPALISDTHMAWTEEMTKAYTATHSKIKYVKINDKMYRPEDMIGHLRDEKSVRTIHRRKNRIDAFVHSSAFFYVSLVLVALIVSILLFKVLFKSPGQHFSPSIPSAEAKPK